MYPASRNWTISEVRLKILILCSPLCNFGFTGQSRASWMLVGTGVQAHLWRNDGLVVVPIMAAMVLLAMDAARALPGSVGGPQGTWQGPENGQSKIAGAVQPARVEVPGTAPLNGGSYGTQPSATMV